MMLMALVAVMCAGVAACGKDEDGSGNAGGSSGDNIVSNPNWAASVVAAGATSGEWVDLGLPSGLLWYSCNLGATAPEEFGDYYAWGEVAPKSDYTWNTYRYLDPHADSTFNVTKYCNDAELGANGFTDTLTTLEAMDDAATQVLGDGARMPTKAEWEELLQKATYTYTTQNDVMGIKFTGRNGKSLFFPYAGYRWNRVLWSAYADRGEGVGNYWSASVSVYSHHAWCFTFDMGNFQHMVDYDRPHGMSVRPVRSAR